MLKIWTDGACLGNGTPQAKGSWAFVTDKGFEASGLGEIGTTNNRMELKAVIEALNHCRTNGYSLVHIYSDSQLVINCAELKWKRKSNHDLWTEYQQAKFGIYLTLEWVRGHNGDPGNERADQLCSDILSQTHQSK